jgi:2-polyprenyl-3-methyl-5-hydroxy-6-metoxy-1,4-benzoquinol methylase
MQMAYRLDQDGIFTTDQSVEHRNDEYQESGFETLLNMQSTHFWYLGRHRFLLTALQRNEIRSKFSAIDLGGGCGGWIEYLRLRIPDRLSEVALADSSKIALMNAKKTLVDTDTYQVDLMSLDWQERWDIAFLLDVIEHCPDDVTVVREAAKALKPAGKLFITTPALDFFWSYNDEYARHLRRYNKEHFQRLAEESGLILKDVRYFMFFLSPLLWLSRKAKPKYLEKAAMLKAIQDEHKVPNALVNKLLALIFCAESPLGHVIPFPWGTSILGIYEKSAKRAGEHQFPD